MGGSLSNDLSVNCSGGNHSIDTPYSQKKILFDQVSHYVGLSTVGFGSTIPGTNNLRRVFAAVERWEGLESTVGYSTLGQGISSSFVGDYSWGRIDLSDRMVSTSYTINTSNGVIGITTGPQVKRRDKLKSTNYVV